jgi:formamidopyrimidine-DNA glycosylase
LAAHVAGRRVTSVSGASIMMRRPLDVEHLAHRLRGRRLELPRRRGKFLLLDTEPDGGLLVHLGMSGRLMLQARAAARLPHTHLVLGLDDGRELRLVDPRRFGFAWWLESGDEITDPSLSALGVEPLDSDLADVLPGLVAGRRAPIKALLLDQRRVAGVGNIYADEALWRARIRPSRPARRIARPRLVRLGDAVREVLTDAVAQGGTTIRDFASPDGDFGYFAVALNVYGRAGCPCPACGADLRRTVVAQRSTVWCATCQR